MKKIINIFRKKPAVQTPMDEFRQLIRSLPGPIKGPERNYSHAELFERLERILSGELDVIYMTRAHGLRDKLTEIIQQRSHQ